MAGFITGNTRWRLWWHDHPLHDVRQYVGTDHSLYLEHFFAGNISGCRLYSWRNCFSGRSAKNADYSHGICAGNYRCYATDYHADNACSTNRITLSQILTASSD